MTSTKVAGHLMIVRKGVGGTSWHLAERSDASVGKCGVKDTRADAEGPWIPAFGACRRCRRIVTREGYTYVPIGYQEELVEI